MSNMILQIENTNSRLVTNDIAFKEFLAEKLRFRPKNYFHNPAFKKKVWDGYKYFFNAKNGIFMTGILPEVKAVLHKMNKEYTVMDARSSIKWQYDKIDQNFLSPWWPEGTKSFELHDYQPDFVNQCIKYNRGIVQAPTGCHRKGQEILMHDGSLKKVEDIEVGENLMGMDSTPRKVLSLIQNSGLMYKIIPANGEPFVVNEDHILSLANKKEILDVSVKDWILWNDAKKRQFKLFRVGVNFPTTSTKIQQPKVNAYLMGYLLGNGSFWGNHNIKTDPNILIEHLKCYGLWQKENKEKFIPPIYKTHTKENRLDILAGIIDSSLHKFRNYIEIKIESKQLAEDICFVARSCGLFAIKNSAIFKDQSYFIIKIRGDLNQIPCKRTFPNFKSSRRNFLKTSFKVEKLGLEKYYGFTLDGDHRYLLSDFTVTHNSGKTFILISLLKCLPPKTPTLFLTKNAQLVHQNWEEMKLWGVENLGRWYDKYKEPNYVMCVTNHVKTYKSLERLLPKFKVLIVDEVHECMSDVPVAAYKKMKNASVRIGISATAFKYDKKKFDNVHKWNLKGHFGPIFKTTTTESGFLTTKELQDRGILSKCDCNFYPVTAPDLTYEPYQDAVKMGIEQNFHFHEMVKKLALSCPGRTLIVVERIEQGHYLNQLIPDSYFIQGKNKLKERIPVINGLRQGEKFVAIVMRQIITAGINVKIHDLINASGGESAHNIIQLLGRGLRTADDKDKLRYHDFHFKINDYLQDHSKWRMEVVQKEGHQFKNNSSFDF